MNGKRSRAPRPGGSRHAEPLTAERCQVLNGAAPARWLNSFLAHADVSAALAELERADKSRDKWLLIRVVRACHNAATFNPKRDDAARTARNHDGRLLQTEIPKQRTAITKLRTFMHNYPEAAGLALGNALLKQRVTFYDEKSALAKKAVNKTPLAELLSGVLEAYADSLGIGVRQGARLHRYQAGPLLYPKPLDQQDSQPRLIARNGLIFELSFLIRYATKGRDAVFDEGMPMPSFGSPHHQCVANLVTAALNKTVEFNDVQQCLRKLKGVGLCNWPHRNR